MRLLSLARRLFAPLTLLLALVQFTCLTSLGQAGSAPVAAPAAPSAAVPAVAPAKVSASAPGVFEPLIGLRVSSTINLSSEIGGSFMPPVKCDADGNLYIRKFAPNRPLGSVIKIDPDGKPIASFDPAVFGSLALSRVEAFSPAADGGAYQIARTGQMGQSNGAKPVLYLVHYASDGSPSSPTHLDADFEVYTFAAFADGSFLVSGSQRDPMDKNDHGHGVTAVFSSDGRELAKVTFQEPKQKAHKVADSGAKAATASGAKSGTGAPSPQVQKDVPAETVKAPEKLAAAMDLKDAEAGRDGNLYVMRTSTQALVDVISASGKIVKTLKIAAPQTGGAPTSFHVSENRIALLFSGDKQQPAAVVVADGQNGRKIAAYSISSDLGSFACYSANDGVFTFLKHGEGNVLEVIRAEQ